MTYFNKAVATAANYLPTQASDVLTQDRAFATFNVPVSALNYRNICALTYIQKNLRLLMASADGCFYMFDVNLQEGGICKLLTQASIYTPNPTLFINNTIGNNPNSLLNNPNFNQNPSNPNQNFNNQYMNVNNNSEDNVNSVNNVNSNFLNNNPHHQLQSANPYENNQTNETNSP